MKKLIGVIVVLLFMYNLFGQQPESEVPLLIKTDYLSSDKPRTEIAMPYISDTINMYATIAVIFESSIDDTSQSLIPTKADLHSLINTSKSGDRISISRFDEITDDKEKFIWNRCADILGKWMMLQPWSNLVDRELISGNALSYGLHICLIPEK